MQIYPHRYWLLFALLFPCSRAAIAQNIPTDGRLQKSISLEFVGPAMDVYSIHYDTRFRAGGKWGARIGATFAYRSWSQRIVSFPVQVNYLLGKTRHFFEVGAGATVYYTNLAGSTWGVDSNEGVSLFATLNLGYRYQPLIRRITARGGVTAAYGSFLPVLVPYVSIGYQF